MEIINYRGSRARVRQNSRRDCFFYCDKCGCTIPRAAKMYAVEFEDGGLFCFCEKCFPRYLKNCEVVKP